MRSAAILVALLFLWPQEAGAARCKAGFVRRLSLGICVDRHSRLAAGFIRSRGRRHDRVVEATPEPAKRQEKVERSHKAAKSLPEEVIPSEDEPLPIDIPVGIEGSMLMRPPPKPYDWLLSPEHQHP